MSYRRNWYKLMHSNQQEIKDLLLQNNLELTPLENTLNQQLLRYDSFQQLISSIDQEADYISEQYQIALNNIKQMEKDLLTDHTCDKYDYMFSAFSGFIAGLVDAVFVGQPYKPSQMQDVEITSKLQGSADSLVDSLVKRFAKLSGWKGAKDGSDSVRSAISFLERTFPVDYDQVTYGEAGAQILGKMSASNHHIKSLAHSPSIIGLIFAIIDQFNGTATFLDNGRLITLQLEEHKYKLQGSNIISKIFCGFCNWLGHVVSDVAGSNGARAKLGNRGSGIPIPFFELLQGFNIGSFGKEKQTIAEIAVKVFEQGYDARFGIALTVPVLINELLIRFFWAIKRYFYHQKELSECIPILNKCHSLERMLLVGTGTLCLIDASDAAINSKGNWVIFFTRLNFIAWVRLAYLGFKEFTFYFTDSLNVQIAQGRVKVLREARINITEHVEIFIEQHSKKADLFFQSQDILIQSNLNSLATKSTLMTSTVPSELQALNRIVGKSLENSNANEFKDFMRKKNGRLKF